MLRCNLVGLQCVLPRSCATNVYVAKSRSRFFFLQHEHLLRKKVVIRATNPLDLQRNIVERQVAPKMLPVLPGLKTSNLVISRCCFADDGKEMDKNENRTAGRAKQLFSPTKYANL